MYPMESLPETQELDYTFWELFGLECRQLSLSGPSLPKHYQCLHAWKLYCAFFCLLTNSGNISVVVYKPASLS